GSMVLWFYGSMVLWFYGSMVLWFYGSMVLWFYGSMVLWFYGSASRLSDPQKKSRFGSFSKLEPSYSTLLLHRASGP
ncbi:hypothetical protein C9I89_19020, partial [Photobacterium lipolyticum]